MSKQKTKRSRRFHSPEFKAETVQLVKAGGRSVAQVCEDVVGIPLEAQGWQAWRKSFVTQSFDRVHLRGTKRGIDAEHHTHQRRNRECQ